MKRFCIGELAIILGCSLLSIELYCLKFLLVIELSLLGTSVGNSIDFLSTEPTILMGIIITIFLIIYGVILIITAKNSKILKTIYKNN